MEEGQRGEEYESQHVHEVYEQIATHFSATRYKPWPVIERFLKELPPGSIGLDIGCGNGKYLTVNPSVFIVGSDRSPNLTKFAAAHQPHAAVVADLFDLPHPLARFDFAISIAVMHHLSTPERRIQGVKHVLDTLVSGGRALVYVWALEQKDSRRAWDKGDDQDVMVPWVLRQPQPKVAKAKKNRAAKDADNSAQDAQQLSEPIPDKTFHRYYHLYREWELNQDVEAAGGIIVESGYDKDNWWAVAEKR
ncbi:hypothetical protein AAFC00_000359 [Neodothiora populina]|uniref:Methyltransferase type 11 domain-containing protein n=1 Tax=Neodothiora populina TaxID=2781224 RepID=A0ABR3PCU3_9PEZI